MTESTYPENVSINPDNIDIFWNRVDCIEPSRALGKRSPLGRVGGDARTRVSPAYECRPAHELFALQIERRHPEPERVRIVEDLKWRFEPGRSGKHEVQLPAPLQATLLAGEQLIEVALTQTVLVATAGSAGVEQLPCAVQRPSDALISKGVQAARPRQG